MPTLSPAAGTYPSDQSVAINVSTTGATIHYETATGGGTPPDPTAASPVYGSPVAVSGDGTTVTIKAMAAKSGMDDSAVVTAAYK